jgi:hypothetical protein
VQALVLSAQLIDCRGDLIEPVRWQNERNCRDETTFSAG